MVVNPIPAWPYRTSGDARRPHLVFLHGFLGSGPDWETAAAALADRYYCILPDLPGHGANMTLPLETTLSYEYLARGLQTTLATTGSRADALIGYSLGGRVALYAALRYPTLARALILESTNPGLSQPAARQQRLLADERQAEQLHLLGLDRFLETWYAQPLFQSLQRRPDLLDRIRQTRAENHPLLMEKVLRELSPGRQPYLGDRWHELGIPVLLMAGKLDEKYANQLNSMGELPPGVRRILVPFAGHTIHAERPERFASVLGAFLSMAFSEPGTGAAMLRPYA